MLDRVVFFVTVEYDAGDDKAKVFISTNIKEKPPFIFWMLAAEYLAKVTAQQSTAGYEKALELIIEGALQYKTIKPNGGEKDGA